MIITAWFRQVNVKQDGTFEWQLAHTSDGFDPSQTMPEQPTRCTVEKWKAIPGQRINGVVYCSSPT